VKADAVEEAAADPPPAGKRTALPHLGGTKRD